MKLLTSSFEYALQLRRVNVELSGLGTVPHPPPRGRQSVYTRASRFYDHRGGGGITHDLLRSQRLGKRPSHRNLRGSRSRTTDTQGSGGEKSTETCSSAGHEWWSASGGLLVVGCFSVRIGLRWVLEPEPLVVDRRERG